jgi:MFS family permease
MSVELKLTKLMGSISHYSIVTVVFQPPATVIARKLGPRNFLSAIVVAWGAVMVGMGFVKSFEALAACRILLGVLEAGFFPSCVYLLSTWYTRFDVGKRYSVFYMLGSLASACAGILAYGIMQIGGKGLPVGTGTKISAVSDGPSMSNTHLIKDTVALDFYHRRCPDNGARRRGILGTGRLPR